MIPVKSYRFKQQHNILNSGHQHKEIKPVIFVDHGNSNTQQLK